MTVNCASVPEHLLEAEFFGYENGAFTGADRAGRMGKLELAHGGTLFLDEIGDMALQLQAKLLRVIEGKEFFRVGGTKPIQVDIRIISATNAPLEELIGKKHFGRSCTTGSRSSRCKSRPCEPARTTSCCWPTPSSSS